MICEIANDDGTVARLPELIEFCDQHGLPLISIEDLIRYSTHDLTDDEWAALDNDYPSGARANAATLDEAAIDA